MLSANSVNSAILGNYPETFPTSGLKDADLVRQGARMDAKWLRRSRAGVSDVSDSGLLPPTRSLLIFLMH